MTEDFGPIDVLKTAMWKILTGVGLLALWPVLGLVHASRHSESVEDAALVYLMGVLVWLFFALVWIETAQSPEFPTTLPL